MGLPRWDDPIGYELILPEGRQNTSLFSMRLVKSELLVLGTRTISECGTGKSVPYDQVTGLFEPPINPSGDRSVTLKTHRGLGRWFGQ